MNEGNLLTIAIVLALVSSIPALKRNWPYRLRFWWRSRKPDFDIEDYLETEYPTIRPLLDGFRPKESARFVGVVRMAACHCRWENAQESIERMASMTGPLTVDAWSDGRRDFRRTLTDEGEKFLGRWGCPTAT